MTEISLHILDIAENSICANATLIEIELMISTGQDLMEVMIRDNGCGMSKEQVEKVLDPFYTTRKTRNVGLGIPFLKMAAESTDGKFSIISEENQGTMVKAQFICSHINRMPLGDIGATIYTLAVFNEAVDIYYKYTYNERSFAFDTRMFREIMGGISFQILEVSAFLKEYLRSNKEVVDGGAAI